MGCKILNLVHEVMGTSFSSYEDNRNYLQSLKYAFKQQRLSITKFEMDDKKYESNLKKSSIDFFFYEIP